MSHGVLDEIDSLRKRLYGELDILCNRASAFFYTSLSMFIIAIILGIILFIEVASITFEYTVKHTIPSNVAVEQLTNTITVFLIVFSILGFILYYVLARFMRVFADSARTVIELDKKLYELGKDRLLSSTTPYLSSSYVEYAHPPEDIARYPRRILTLYLIAVPIGIIAVRFLLRGLLLLGATVDLVIGGVLGIAAIAISIVILVIVYEFFNSIKHYYDVGRAGTVGSLYAASQILGLLGLIPAVGRLFSTIAFIIFILYLIFLYIMVGDLRRETERLLARLDDIVDELRREARKSGDQRE